MDDSKSRARHVSNHTHARERQQQLVALFVVGLCAGIIISERLYVRSTRAALRGEAAASPVQQQITLPSSTADTSAPTAAVQLQQLDRKFMRAGSSSVISRMASSSSTVSTAALAGALAAEVAVAEAAAVAALSKQLAQTDPQLQELQGYLQKVRAQAAPCCGDRQQCVCSPRQQVCKTAQQRHACFPVHGTSLHHTCWYSSLCTATDSEQ
jgi:hypothetical protein